MGWRSNMRFWSELIGRSIIMCIAALLLGE
jgi:hypothetical protein